MGNCLVTKLKAAVNNDDLVKLGVIELVNRHLENPSSNDTYHFFRAPNATLAKMKNVRNGVEEAGPYYDNNVSAGNGYDMDIIRLYDKYNYTELQIGLGFTIANVESLKNCTSLVTYNVPSEVPDYILGTMTSLTLIEQRATPVGSAEKLTEVARACGRTSGYIYKPWNIGLITIGGWRIASSTQRCELDWDENFEWASNGNTPNQTPPTIVWTNEKTSAARIAEWNAQGTTVYVYKNGSLIHTYNPTNQ